MTAMHRPSYSTTLVTQPDNRSYAQATGIKQSHPCAITGVAALSLLAPAANVCIKSLRTYYQWHIQWLAKCYQTIIAVLKTKLSQWCHGRCRQHYRPLLLAGRWCKWAWVRTHAAPRLCRQCSRKLTSLAAGCTPTRSEVSSTQQ